ncbi:ninja-family protein mc410 isoform X2 [Neltuma alba]|uniref:ninja-family protein mc410 isoform X2 n=1 Tax=Neltuma alba TaxID=207710 RepID=UPI0010A56047|nr:ninja-family protein mc410 isoform X2 [Prosopis alba]
MDDENGLELSLGLSCGGSSAKPKSKNGASSDSRTEEVGRGGKMVDDFKSFFQTDSHKQDLTAGAQRADPPKLEENFFNDLSKDKEEEASVNLSGRGLWLGNNNKSVEIEEDKRLEVGNKRKMMFDEVNHQKKHESEALHDKARTSHISLTEDGSAAENEDVADSETENLTSRSVSRHDDGSKRLARVGGSSDALKEVRGASELSPTDVSGQKRFTGSSEKDFKLSNLNYAASFPQQVNVMNVPYPPPVKESNSVGAPNPQIPGVMHVMSTAAGERPGAQPVTNGNLPVMLGYSSVQVPMLDKENSWSLISHPQQLHPSFAGRAPPNSEAMPSEGRLLDRAIVDGKQLMTEEGAPSQAEDMKGSSTNLRAKDVPDQSAGESFSIDFSAIKPGLAANLTFGGSGSCPNLPWVSTTGSGPNGRTISGVTYRYSTNQVKIVCACHGSHMSPEEFVRHANEDLPNAEGGAVLGTKANGNSAASAHS